MYQIVNLYLETWVTRVTSNRKAEGKSESKNLKKKKKDTWNNEKRPKGNVLNMRIYAAQTLLHAADPLNTLRELTPNLISSSQSEFY